jgi:formylmethanofuran dehydrogenase subunit C
MLLIPTRCMSGWTLRAKQTPALRVDLRGVVPSALALLSAAEVERWPVGYGKMLLPLAEFFHVQPREDDALVFDADLARFDRVGWLMEGGRLHVEGDVGDHAGALMRAGHMQVQGRARDLAACEMACGCLTIEGSVGDFAASTLPGSMDGMRGGTLIIKGRAGARFADRMRRGTALVFGDCGDFLAARLVAGTIAVGGAVGAHAAYGMRRGSLVFAGGAPAPPPGRFVRAGAGMVVVWQLLARDLAQHGGPFAALAARQPERHLGDLAVAGKGEWIVAG